MEFSPGNPIVKLCLQGIGMEENNQSEDASRIFLRAWNEATNDFEKFLAAHFLARSQHSDSNKLQWLETALQFALKINDITVQSALPSLYLNVANCLETIGEVNKAAKYYKLANSAKNKPIDKGPFYHGTKADLLVGDLLTAGGTSNYQAELKMNHIYFTAVVNGAGLAAELAKGDGPAHVYMVEPTGSFENDPNVTDQKFPGNPTRSYRSQEPLKIIGEVKDWARLTPEELQKWRERLANVNGRIIN